MIVIPVINVSSAEEAKERLENVSEFADWVHIDISDGVFTPYISWGSPGELSKLKIDPPPPIGADGGLKFKIEIHLMVSDPEAVIGSWLQTGFVKRVVVHLEAMVDPSYILEQCKKYGVESMLAVNPDTAVERLAAYAGKFKYFQILAVSPGPSGQKFSPQMAEKIKLLQTMIPNAIIEVDGGIDPKTAKIAKDAGADIIVSASYIFGSQSPRQAFEELSRI